MKTKIIIIISILLILTINVNAITVEYTTLKETNNYWELINLIDEYTLKKKKFIIMLMMLDQPVILMIAM